MIKNIPFDLAAIDRIHDWQDGFEWPLPHSEIKSALRQVTLRYLDAIRHLGGSDFGRTLVLCSRVLSDLLLTVEASMLAAAAGRRGCFLAGGPEEVRKLQGLPISCEEMNYTPPGRLNYRPIRYQLLRRMARTYSWTPFHRMPATALWPDVVALSHNDLLRSEARQSMRRIKFVHAESFIARSRADNCGDIVPVDQAEIKSLLHGVIFGADGVNPEHCNLIVEIVSAKVLPYLDEMNTSLMSLRSLKFIPNEIWAGTGGHAPVRTIALEAKRRGHHVTLHDHAGAAGLFKEVEGLAFTELAVADRFVTTTEATRELVVESEAVTLRPSITPLEIVSGGGDPGFKNLAVTSRRADAERPKVLYVVGAFDGARRRSPPSLADPVKLDWWSRVAATLQAMPIEVLIQAHPGGVMRGKPNPLERYAATTGRVFEEAIEWADTLVIDITQSTTLTRGLTSDRAIVLVDYGRNEFSEKLQTMVDRRCVTVKAHFDDRNLPCLNPDELEYAIFAAPSLADPSEFRTHFAGAL